MHLNGDPPGGALAFGSTKTHPESLPPWTTSEAVFIALKDIKPVAKIIGHIDQMEDDEIENAQCAVLDKDTLQNALAASLSFGGARPKALVTVARHTWIAKFSSFEDPWCEPTRQFWHRKFLGHAGGTREQEKV